MIQKRTQSKGNLKERLTIFCFTNETSSFILVVIVFILKLTMVFVYTYRAVNDDVTECNYCGNSSLLEDGEVNWNAIIWIQKPFPIWIVEAIISTLTLSRMFIVTYLRFKGNIFKVVTFNFVFETCMSLPIIITIFIDSLRQIYFPSFFNCWLAKRMLDQNILSHRRLRYLSLFTQKAVAVITTLICLVFSGVCAIEHIQRGSFTNLTLFEAFYFVMVTLSTVGYGDISPDIWPSQICVILLILVAIVILPKQFESLASTWLERQKLGGTYGRRGGGEAKHVVVCSTVLTIDILEDFLAEFYSHRLFQDFYSVFMSPSELDAAGRRLLQSPLWLHRTMFIKGSCLKDDDLARAGVKEASAVFLIGDAMQTDKSIADHHTVLRSRAVRNYAPANQLHVQIWRPENKVQIKFAKSTVCEDEIKYAMLAYNCFVPGTSTFLTLLLHTSKGREGQLCSEEWLKIYGKHSGNEIYAIRLIESYIFGQYLNTNFTYAALHAHKKYGTILIGVQPTKEPNSIILNPGPSYIMKETDICIYLSITKEEDMTFDVNHIKKTIHRPSPETKRHQIIDVMSKVNSGFVNDSFDSNFDVGNFIKITYGTSSLPTLDEYKYSDSSHERWIIDIERSQLRTGYLPIVPYIGMSRTLCHLRRDKKPRCCLAIDQVCKHCVFNSVKQYAWPNRLIILVAKKAVSGFYNFIIPLRAYYHQRKFLKPIILLLEEEPDASFLDSISWFPLVFWMKGSLSNLDDLLAAGINFADNVVIVSNDSKLGETAEDDLADSETVMIVNLLQRYFPDVKFTTELSQASNMRFINSQASDDYAIYMSTIEKMENQRGSSLSFMFRLQFAAGAVFSANMMATMLYQGFLKEYLIPVVMRILGIVQSAECGFLTSMVVSKREPWAKTYGSLFTFLSAASGDVPVAIYRTEVINNSSANHEVVKMTSSSDDTVDIKNMIQNRLKSLGLSEEDYDLRHDAANEISYVIINPHHDLELKDEDIIFLIRPSQVQLLRKPKS